MLRRITLVLTLCGLMAPVLVAQNAPVNTRVYISLYNVKYGDIPEYTAFYEANTRPILESMVAEGTITGFGIHMHIPEGSTRYASVFRVLTTQTLRLQRWFLTRG